MNPDKTAPKGPYCLQYTLLKYIYKQMNEKTAIGLNGGKKFKTGDYCNRCITSYCVCMLTLYLLFFSVKVIQQE